MNKARIVWIKTAFFFTLEGHVIFTCMLQCYTAFTVLLVPRLFGGRWQCRWTAARGDRESPFSGVTNYDRVWRKSAEDWGFESVLASCQLWPEQRRPSKMCVTRRVPRQYYLLPVVFVVLLLLLLLAFLSWNPEVHLGLGETVVCAAISPHPYALPYIKPL